MGRVVWFNNGEQNNVSRIVQCLILLSMPTCLFGMMRPGKSKKRKQRACNVEKVFACISKEARTSPKTLDLAAAWRAVAVIANCCEHQSVAEIIWLRSGQSGVRRRLISARGENGDSICVVTFGYTPKTLPAIAVCGSQRIKKWRTDELRVQSKQIADSGQVNVDCSEVIGYWFFDLFDDRLRMVRDALRRKPDYKNYEQRYEDAAYAFCCIAYAQFSLFPSANKEPVTAPGQFGTLARLLLKPSDDFVKKTFFAIDWMSAGVERAREKWPEQHADCHNAARWARLGFERPITGKDLEVSFATVPGFSAFMENAGVEELIQSEC